MSSGCGCKEVYRFPHNYLSLLLLYLFFLFLKHKIIIKCKGNNEQFSHGLGPCPMSRQGQ